MNSKDEYQHSADIFVKNIFKPSEVKMIGIKWVKSLIFSYLFCYLYIQVAPIQVLI